MSWFSSWWAMTGEARFYLERRKPLNLQIVLTPESEWRLSGLPLTSRRRIYVPFLFDFLSKHQNPSDPPPTTFFLAKPHYSDPLPFVACIFNSKPCGSHNSAQGRFGHEKLMESLSAILNLEMPEILNSLGEPHSSYNTSIGIRPWSFR